MKRLLASLMTVVVLSATAVSPGGVVTPDGTPAWFCRLMPFLCSWD